MNVELAQRIAVQIFSVRVDVVVGNLVGTMVTLLADVVARLEHRERGILRAEHNRINFTLARSELAVRGNGARNVRGVAGILSANVENYDVSVRDLAIELVVVQHRRIGAGADDRSVAFSF